MAVQPLYIDDLPAVADPATELPGGYVEVETLTGPNGSRQNKRATIEQLATQVAGSVAAGPVGNAIPGQDKEFLAMNQTDAALYYGGASFDQLDYATCRLGTIATVEFYRATPTSPWKQKQQLVAVYDGSPSAPHRIYRTGAFTPGDLAPGKFVEIESAEAQTANIPLLDPTKTDYLASFIVQWPISGTVRLFKSASGGGPHAAPTTAAGTTYWLPVAPPPALVPAPTGNAIPGGDKCVLYLTQAEAVAAGRPGFATLDQVDPLTCCTGVRAYVDLPSDGGSNYRVLRYDARPAGSPGQLRAYFDGRCVPDFSLSPTDGLAPLAWVEPTRDPYGVPTAKRKQVVDANAPAVPEADEAYYGCAFVDEVYGAGKPAYYQCMPSAPALSSGATVWKWFRLNIL